MLLNRLLYICAFLGAWAFYAWYTPWVSLFVLLLVLALPLFSLAVSLPSMLGARLELSAPRRCLRGSGAELAWRLCCRGALAPVCRFTLTVSTGEKPRRVRIRPFAQGGEMALPTQHCGKISCSLRKAKVFDRLGLFALPVKAPQGTETLVESLPRAPEPRPDLSRFAQRAFRPKPGGGFAEVHELREYRPGDAMRDVHWKLSAKTDGLIVREAQQPEKLRAVISLELCLPRENCDRALDILAWLSEALLEKGADHRVCCLFPEGDLWLEISTEAELESGIHALLRRLPAEGRRGTEPVFAQSDWHYHISGEAEA